MMALPKLPLDIAVPPAVLCRRGGVSLTGIIIRTFLQVSLVSYLHNFIFIFNSHS
jgi:hypothetical protein